MQYRSIGGGPEVVSIDGPDPGPGQVVLKVTAAGLCHTDVGLMSRPADKFPFQLPLTLGHEPSGTTAALGEGTVGFSAGDSVAVCAVWGCGHCMNCMAGEENYCLYARQHSKMGPGLGFPGALAQYMLVDSVTPSSSAWVGWGTWPFRSCARVLSNSDAFGRVRALTGVQGAQVVFDFVGNSPTLAMAVGMVGIGGHISAIGLGGGTLPYAFGTLPYDATIGSPFGGNGNDLLQVVNLARSGLIDTHVETFALDEAPRAYELLDEGKITGGAVVLPNG